MLMLMGCSADPPGPAQEVGFAQEVEVSHSSEITREVAADVISVQVMGDPQDYRFSVEVSSPDTGCDQYADWWEVVTEVGKLIYRRILLHSHVDEQPFTRSGGSVSIGPETVVIVRAHMNSDGYGGKAMVGTPESGFEVTDLPQDFALDLEHVEPLPTDCAF